MLAHFFESYFFFSIFKTLLQNSADFAGDIFFSSLWRKKNTCVWACMCMHDKKRETGAETHTERDKGRS